MRLKLFCLFLLIFGVVTAEVAKGPPGQNERESGDKSETPESNERKTDRTESADHVANTDDDDAEPDEDKTLEAILNDELGMQGTIKVIRPKFHHERDEVSNILSTLVSSHDMLIKKFEKQIRQIDGSLSGIRTEDEPPKAQTPEEIEAENLYETAMKIMNRTRSDKSAGFAILQEAASKGHLQAQAKVAWGQLMGNPVEIDVEAARTAFQELAEKGVPDAHMVCQRYSINAFEFCIFINIFYAFLQGLGFMHAVGIGFNVSQAKAIVHYTIAALGDNTYAQMALGYRYWSGISIPVSCEKALDFYRKVATKVASKITFSGGAAVHRVRLVDEAESSGLSSAIFDNDLLEYYQLLAGKGDVQAQVGLGQLHYQGGRGMTLDHQKALQYFTQAANAGNAVAMAFLGKIYLEGSENIKADNETALKYFKKAAELGNPVGQSGLGIMYLQGKGVPKDTAKALSYFTQAADQGWVDGQLQLGNMYFSKLELLPLFIIDTIYR